MSIIAMATITPKNYQAFRRLIKNDLPEFIETWRGSRSRKRADHLRKFSPHGDVREIEISLDEFTAYCDRTCANYTLEALDRLAAEKAFG